MILCAGATQGWGPCTTGEACTTGATQGCAIWGASNSLFHIIGINRLDNTGVTWSYFPAEYVQRYSVVRREIERASMVRMTLINPRWCFKKWGVITQIERVTKNRTRIMIDIETSTKTKKKVKEDFVIKCLELLEIVA